MADIDSLAIQMQRIADLLEHQVHGGQTGLGTSRIGAGPGFDSKQFDNLIKNVKQSSAQFGMFNKVLKANQTIALQVADSLDDLDTQLKALDETTLDVAENAEKRAMISAKRKELADAAAIGTMQQTQAQLRVSLGKSAGILTAGIGKVISGLTGGSSAFALSSDIMSAGLDFAGETSKTAGNAIGAVGNTMALSTNPKVKALGLVAGIAGPLVGALGDAASKAAKFGLDILTKEVEKNIKAFHAASNAGALYVDGMTGLNNAASDAGLTVDMFANLLTKHSKDLAESGLGVGEGAALLGKVAKELRTSGVQTQLQKLGFGIEEQAELIADTTANMRRSAGSNSTQADIATQTAKYAESLRTIAGITGEDARKKTEEAKAQNQILAFQQEMAKKTPAQRAEIDAAMATMTEQEKKNFRDRAVFGTVINQEGAIYEATMAGAREKGEAQLELLNNNNMTAKANAQLNAQFGDQLRDSALSQQAFGQAGMVVGGAIGEVAKSMLDAVNQANSYTKDAVAATAEALAGQKVATDKLTTGVVAAEAAMMKFATDMQKLMLDPMARYADFTGDMLESMRKMVEQATGSLMNQGKSQDDVNWAKMKWYQKTESGLARGIERVGGIIDGALGGIISVGAESLGGKSVADTKAQRIAEETEYFAGQPAAEIVAKAAGGYTEPGKINIAGEAGSELIIPLTTQGTIKEGTAGAFALSNILPGLDTMTTNNNTTVSHSTSQTNIDELVGLIRNLVSNSTARTQSPSSELVDAITALVNISAESLEKQDEMLRAMNDTKDYTGRLYDVMA